MLAIIGADPFAVGVQLRANVLAARPYFAEAARLADEAWAGGDCSAATARMRVAAHRLAGDVPRAVLAARQGLTVTPWDAGLQQMLERCRDAVAYPSFTEPIERMRPEPPTGLRYRVGPTVRGLASVGVTLLLMIGFAARLTARPRWDIPVVTCGLVSLAAFTLVALRLETAEPPVAVVTTPSVLRTGNAQAYLPRVIAPLPRGAEVAPLGYRGGWVQVQLAGGAVGWLPESALLTVPDPSAVTR